VAILDEFIKIVESEALTLHAMMMTSMPYLSYMKPNTLQIINAIWI
jgi:diphosphomevalonate decarboxylase